MGGTPKRHDWSTLNGKTVVDIGGGLGTVMESVANAHPGIAKLISLDTENVIGMAHKPSNEKVWKQEGCTVPWQVLQVG